LAEKKQKMEMAKKQRKGEDTKETKQDANWPRVLTWQSVKIQFDTQAKKRTR